MFTDFDVDFARSSFQNFDVEDSTIPVGGTFTTSSWNAGEDYDLCYIWCALSNDAIRGCDQSGDSFWGRVTNCYNRKNTDRKRSLSSIKGRFGKINRQTQTFDSQMFKLKQTNPSGYGSETNLRMAANKMFKNIYRPDNKQAPHMYQFMHVYDLLIEHEKWKSSLQKSVHEVQSGRGKGKAARLGESSSPGGSMGSQGTPSDEGLTPNDDTYVRPLGAKAAKKKQAAGIEQEDFKNLLLESEDRYNRAMELRVAQHQEKKLKMERLLAGNRQRDDDAVMFVDTSNMSEEQREYVESRRREILRRRRDDGL